MFIPCLGAYLTPDLLGGGKTVMAGNLIQNQFTTARDWPFGSAVSLILMAIVLALLVSQHADTKRGSAVKNGRACRCMRRLRLRFCICRWLCWRCSASTARDSPSGRDFHSDGTKRRFRTRNSRKQPGTAWLSRVASTFVSTCLGTMCAYALWKRRSTRD